MQALSMTYKVNFIVYSMSSDEAFQVDNNFIDCVLLWFGHGEHYDLVVTKKELNKMIVAQELMYDLLALSFGNSLQKKERGYRNIQLHTFFQEQKEREESDRKLAMSLDNDSENPYIGLTREGNDRKLAMSLDNYSENPYMGLTREELSRISRASIKESTYAHLTRHGWESAYSFMPKDPNYIQRKIVPMKAEGEKVTREDSNSSSSESSSESMTSQFQDSPKSSPSLKSRKADSVKEIIVTHALRLGWMYKRGGGHKSSAWKLRWCVLSRSRILYYFKNEQEKRPKGGFKIAGFKVENYTDLKKEFCFMLIPPESDQRTWYFAALNPKEQGEWMILLKAVATQRGSI